MLQQFLQNMRSFNFIKAAALAAAVLSVAACGSKAHVSGVVADAPESDIIVSLLNVNNLTNIDTVKTDANGKFTLKLDVEQNKPEFVYLFRNGVRIAPLLVEAGDKIKVETDTLGNYTITGGTEAELYAEVEKDYSAFLAKIDELAEAEDVKGVKTEYVNYYRGRLKFIAEHPYAMSLIPIVYQTVGDVPVFGQNIDAIHFNNICDSLETRYPDSRYVKGLRQTAKARANILDLEVLLANAQPIGYPDIELPDINAQKVKLSDVDAKVVLVHFWGLSPEMKMMNLDVLKPIYDDFHSKGLEIYSVALESDKTAWANVMKGQKLPWINVCDVAAAGSQYIVNYALNALPTTYVLCNGELVNDNFTDEDGLRELLRKLLN